jgi:RNA polymerase sigma-70 factor (ECF subfamily)
VIPIDEARRRPDGPVDSVDDWATLDDALRGNERAAAELVRRHGGRLYACAFRVLGDAGAAEEIVQDAFDQLFRRGAELRRESALSTWLYSVALNRCRDTLRRPSFSNTRSVQPLDPDMPDRSPNTHELAERRDRDERLRSALSTLSADMREVIALRFASGLSYQEIAALQGCAEGTVASRLHRALERLGTSLQALGFTREGA